ncbi:hypothetical protein RD792_005462 [Penstemon davidsonii]|uniref:Uncharacterized protein n=1 Tax=Penstemon davidsonii TaxID=160366 RepID=A0ABR0DK80_9LAMI|nr:hypothetical protein RD792_005462 [Penstemon davidsonii]
MAKKSRLRGHFGELSVLPSGSFTVDKCFDASNLSLRETIVSELLPIQTELSRTKQGPYLLKKLDVEGFARRPDQWKSRQASKESAYKEFYAAFGSKESKSSGSENFLADNRPKSQPEKLKDMRKEIETHLSSGAAPFLAHQGSTKGKKSGNKRESKGFANDVIDDDSSKRKNKRQKMENAEKNSNDEKTIHSEKSSSGNNEKKRRKKDGLSKSSKKKVKAGISD